MSKKIKFLIFGLFFVVTLFGLADFAFGQETDVAGLQYGEELELGNRDPRIVVANVIRIILGFLGILAVGIIIYGGWMYMTSEGNAEKVETAKKILTSASIGLVIILASFGIASFIINRLLGATGVGGGGDSGCVDGDTRICCQGTQECIGGSWGSCSDSECNVGGIDFYIRRTNPRDGEDDVVRNVKISAFLNRSLSNETTQEILDGNFKVEQIEENINPETGIGEEIAPVEVGGSVETSYNDTMLSFIVDSSCQIEDQIIENCLPEWSKFQVTVNGGDDVFLDNDNTRLNDGREYVFEFSTNNEVDLGPPVVGATPGQICKDDGSLKEGANRIYAWSRDDKKVLGLAFYAKPSVGIDYTENFSANDLDWLPEDFQARYPTNSDTDFFSISHLYNTSNMMAGDEYIFMVESDDAAGSYGYDHFVKTVRPGHCCNGIQDADEEGIDCGGSDCDLCNGDACSLDPAGSCGDDGENCDHSLCSSGFCNCTTCDEASGNCQDAGYSASLESGCICQEKPVIFNISPTDENDIPNGAPGNFITIYGKNFGTISGSDTDRGANIFGNTSFESDTVGQEPSGWEVIDQARSSIAVTNLDASDGSQSLNLVQEAGEVYPGVCSQALCEGADGSDYPYSDDCTWYNNQCNFPNRSSCENSVCVFDDGETLGGGYENLVMYAGFAYDISDLDFVAGEKYKISFKYRGDLATNLKLFLGYNLGWPGQSYPIGSSGQECTRYDGDAVCPDNPNLCCRNVIGGQKDRYPIYSLEKISAGDYGSWQNYEMDFYYPEYLSNLFDRNGNSLLVIAFAAGYADTTSGGSDFYIDDISFSLASARGVVNFVGPNESSVQAIDPSTINPNCINTWEDNQIIVVVPDVSTDFDGPIEVVTQNGLSDRTDDGYGNLVSDFNVNDIVRPGLCYVSPSSDILVDTPLLYQGANLRDSLVKFGSDDNNVEAKGYEINSNSSRGAITPLVEGGEISTFAEKDGLASNYLYINKADEYFGPKISYFEPETGSKGQYVSIFGRGFGNEKGDTKVYFGNAEADHEFPLVCSDSVWADDQIVVKVPEMSDGDYLIKIDFGDEEIDTSDLEKPTFKVDNSSPLTPGICKIDPDFGLTGTEVGLWGEYFGDYDPTYSKIKFTRDKNATIVTNSWGTDTTVTEGLQPDKASAALPEGTQTGTVKLYKGVDQLESNGMVFEVGSCLEADDPDGVCGVNKFCCPSGSFREGQCQEDEDACYFKVSNSVYEFEFSTGGACPNGSEQCGAVCCSTNASCGGGCDDEAADTCNGCATGQNLCDDCTCCNGPCSDPDADEPGDSYCPDAPSSCSAYGINQCTDNYFCPNSPGRCSPYFAEDKEVGDCDCEGVGGCTAETCSPQIFNFATSSAACILDSNTSCDLVTSTKYADIGGDSIEAFCDDSVWQIRTEQNCPNGFEATQEAGICRSSDPCDSCLAGYDCIDDLDNDEMGVCGVDQELCNGRSSCDLNSEKCLTAGKDACDCCCEIGQDARDCCPPLTCEGSCGTGYIDENNNGAQDADENRELGSCSGCALVGSTQAEHDLACNCTGTSGKFCDTGDPDFPTGVCRDCAQLSSAGLCSDHHATCCVDAMASDGCRGLESGGTVEDLYYKEVFRDDFDGNFNWDVFNSDVSDYYIDDGVLYSNADDFFQISKDFNFEANKTYQVIIKGDIIDNFNKDIVLNNKVNYQGIPRKMYELNTSSGEKEYSLLIDDLDQDYSRFHIWLYGDSGEIGLDYVSIREVETLNYCSYYSCDNDCAEALKIGTFASSTICDDSCGGNLPGSSCYDETFKACSITCMNPYTCSGESGCSGSTGDNACDSGDGSCLCCCDVNNDACPGDLKCKDAEPCSGGDRGLCCGCSEDSQCGNEDLIGCGSDTCCRARPIVESMYPKGGLICPNVQIGGSFSDIMNSSSLTGNVLLVGDYGDDACPANTQYLVKNFEDNNQNIFARTYRKIKRVFKKVVAFIFSPFIGNSAYAELIPGNNYCAVKGAIETKYNSETEKSEFIFRQEELLDKGRDYYVIVRGGENGVKSNYNISMNGEGLEGYDAEVKFNNVAFPDAKVWKFTTKNDLDSCLIDHVEIDPVSYLFNKNKNDINENDIDDDVRDSDKIFEANAYSSEGQEIIPLPGYAWNWNWSTEDTNVADIVHGVMGLPDSGDRQLIRTGEDVEDARTRLHAEVVYDIRGYYLEEFKESGDFKGWNPEETANIYSVEESKLRIVKNNSNPYSKFEIKKTFNDEEKELLDVGGSNGVLALSNKLYGVGSGIPLNVEVCGENTPGNFSCVSSILPMYKYSMYSYLNFNINNIISVSISGYMNQYNISQIDIDRILIDRGDRVLYQKSAESELYVFVCENPWPPSDNGLNWEPWKDDSNECDSGDACYGMNFELYYCRDAGVDGTYDDLPAILDDAAILGDKPGDNDDVLKEYYFFREGVPEISDSLLSLSGSSDENGESVNLSWDKIGGLVGYKVYYGDSPGARDNSLRVDNPTDEGVDRVEVNISKLENGELLEKNGTYYFSISALNEKTESQVSNEITVNLLDSTKNVPEITEIIPGDRSLKISWSDDPEMISYSVHYRARVDESDNCENVQNYGGKMDVKEGDSYVLSNLVNGTTYCISVSGLHESGVRVMSSAGEQATPVGLDN